MSKEALIIVDVQNDFCPGGALPITEGDLVVKPINRMIKYARANDWIIIATRDWHPQKTTHFDKWPPHCVQGTTGAKFHSDLDLRGVLIFSKGMDATEDSYSGFDARNENRDLLGNFLKRERIKRIKIGGLALDYCDKATALDGIRHNFDVDLLIDCCKAVNINPNDGREALCEMILKGVEISDTRLILNQQ